VIASVLVLIDNKIYWPYLLMFNENMLHPTQLLTCILTFFPIYLSAQDTVYTWSSNHGRTYGDAPPTALYGYKDTQEKEQSTTPSIKGQNKQLTPTLTAGELANQAACQRENAHLRKAQSLQDKASRDTLVALYQKARAHFCH